MQYGCLWPVGAATVVGSLQYDDRQRPLFLHRARQKFTLSNDEFQSRPQDFGGNSNRFHADLPHEAFCHQALHEFGIAW